MQTTVPQNRGCFSPITNLIYPKMKNLKKEKSIKTFVKIDAKKLQYIFGGKDIDFIIEDIVDMS